MLNIPVPGEPVVDEDGRSETSWYNYWMEAGFELRKLITATATGIVNSWNGRTGAVMPAAGDYDASQITNFTETAQDAVGNILVDTTTIDFTYNDVTDAITARVVANSIDNTFLADMVQGTVKMRRPAAGTGDPTDTPLATLKTDMAFTKADVGLGNVDNTSDANKPVSTAQQTALNLKADLASPALTGNPTAPTAAPGDNDTSIATTAFVTAADTASAATKQDKVLTTGQLAFPATQIPSADPNTLDDYEEGSWTPTLSAATPPTGVTYSTQDGSYIKIGRLVYVSWRLSLTSKGASGNGQARIAGLPFATSGSHVSSNYRGSGYTNPSSGFGQFGFASGTVINVLTESNTTARDVQWGDITNAWDAMGSLVYMVA